MLVAISRVFFGLLLVSTLLSCEEETDPYHGHQYITESKASISLRGKYRGIPLNDHYHLVFTPERIGYSQAECTDVQADGISQLVCNKMSGRLFSPDLNSSLGLDICTKEDDILSISYHFRLTKTYGVNQVAVISGSNVGLPFYFLPYSDDPPDYSDLLASQKLLPEEYKVDDLQYDRATETISFKMVTRHHPDDDTDYELTGLVSLKIYQSEVFLN